MTQSKFYILLEVDNDLSTNTPDYYTELYTNLADAKQAAKMAHDQIIEGLKEDHVPINLDTNIGNRDYNIETDNNHYHLEIQASHIQK